MCGLCWCVVSGLWPGLDGPPMGDGGCPTVAVCMWGGRPNAPAHADPSAAEMPAVINAVGISVADGHGGRGCGGVGGRSEASATCGASGGTGAGPCSIPGTRVGAAWGGALGGNTPIDGPRSHTPGQSWRQLGSRGPISRSCNGGCRRASVRAKRLRAPAASAGPHDAT